jgi:hypothetical protein
MDHAQHAQALAAGLPGYGPPSFTDAPEFTGTSAVQALGEEVAKRLALPDEEVGRM